MPATRMDFVEQLPDTPLTEESLPRLCLGLREGESVRLEFDTLVPLPGMGDDDPDDEQLLLGARRVKMHVTVQKVKGSRVQLLFEAPRAVDIQRKRENKQQPIPR